MSETARLWQESPVLHFSDSSNLPGLIIDERPNGERIIDSHNRPGKLQQYEVNEQLIGIQGIVSVSVAEHGRENVGKLYMQSMGERYGLIRFLSGAQELSMLTSEIKKADIKIDAQPPEIKQAVIEDIDGLNKMGERLFGKIDPERLEAMIARTRRSATEVLMSNPSTTPVFRAAAARRLLDSLPHVPDAAAEKHIYKPSSELLEAYKEPVQKKYASFLSLVPETKKTYTGNELSVIFNQAKDIMSQEWGLEGAEDWKIGRGGTNISVTTPNKTIWIPEHQAEISALKVKQLLVHEIGVHLLRNLLGELSGDPFLATQMAGRDKDEEAYAMFIQHVISGKAEESGVMHYVNIGLAQGILTNGVPVNPYDLQQISTDMFAIKPSSTQQGSELNGLKATSRIVTGMPSIEIDGRLHQVVHPGNLKYALGQANAVRWFKEHRDNPYMALDVAVAGKFAYSRPNQVDYAAQKYSAIADLHNVPSAA
jgi:hypothetical protein